jgi:hypothetical protein
MVSIIWGIYDCLDLHGPLTKCDSLVGLMDRPSPQAHSWVCMCFGNDNFSNSYPQILFFEIPHLRKFNHYNHFKSSPWVMCLTQPPFSRVMMIFPRGSITCRSRRLIDGDASFLRCTLAAGDLMV